MLLDQLLNLGDLLRLEAEVGRQFHNRLDPELRLAVRMLNMNVRSPFLARKELEAKSLDPQNGRTHRIRITQPPGSWPAA